MADIKAKDISVAQSIASSDLILGSSIAGTTANVTVETVGKYIIEQLNLSSLNDTVSEYVRKLSSRIQKLTKIQNVSVSFTGTQSSEWEYTGLSLTVPSNHVYIVWGLGGWEETTPKGFGLSISNQRTWFRTMSENTSGILVFNTPPIILQGKVTMHLWEKRWSNGTNTDTIQYIDLGEISPT